MLLENGSRQEGMKMVFYRLLVKLLIYTGYLYLWMLPHHYLWDSGEKKMSFYFLCPLLLEILHLHLKAIRQAGEGVGKRISFNSFWDQNSNFLLKGWPILLWYPVWYFQFYLMCFKNFAFFRSEGLQGVGGRAQQLGVVSGHSKPVVLSCSVLKMSAYASWQQKGWWTGLVCTACRIAKKLTGSCLQGSFDPPLHCFTILGLQ